MKKILLLTLLFSISLAGQSQSYRKSKFLYAAAAETTPYSLGFFIGQITKSQLTKSDYTNESNDLALDLYFEKPINYRFSLLLDARLIGDFYGESLANKYNLQNSYDLNASIKYLLMDHPFAKLYVASGMGILNRSTHIQNSIIDTNSTNQANVVIPVGIYLTKPINKRIDLSLVYRNYWTFKDDIDGLVMNGNMDQYQFIGLGLSYNFGTKDYRFKKQNKCPGQN